MATWYVAPDATTVPGVTVAAIGATGYAASWPKAAKWSDFNNGAGSVWATKYVSGDTIVFLAAQYNLSAAVGGWVNLNTSFPVLTMTAQTVDGNQGTAVFVGGRTAPWPLAGDSAATIGETMFRLLTGITSISSTNMRFRNMGYPFAPASNATTPILGTITYTDCSSQNTAGGLCYTSTRTDGMLNVVGNRIKCHGYSKGNFRQFGAITVTDWVFDSEFQSTSAGRASASSTSGAHVLDSLPGFATSTWPLTATRGIGRNHAAGSSGSGYSQGDALIGEENAGMFTGYRILTYGNGDRGVDLKCAGTGQFIISWGDGTAGVSHHLDTLPYNGFHHLLKAGSRPLGATTACACVQTSGLVVLVQSALVCKPTAAQLANNVYALTTGNNDPSKFQSSIYGSYHQGNMKLIDCWAVYAGTLGATEQNGYTQSADNARNAAVFGLTPGATYTFAVRAHAQDGSASALSAGTTFVMDAVGIGDVTGPLAPTGLVISAQTSSTVTLAWNQLAPDLGSELQGYVFEMSTDGGTTWTTVMPGKSASPVTFSGLKPATTYKWRLFAYDCNSNTGTRTGVVTGTTSAGATDTATPSVPLAPGIASLWLNHPTTAGLAWTLPASGTVAYYEVVNTANSAVMTRNLPIPSSSTSPTYTKTNVSLSSV